MPGLWQRLFTPRQPDTVSNRPGITEKESKRTHTGLSQKFVDVLGWIITGMWALSMILHAINIGYEPPASIHILMMVVAGAAFGTTFIKPKNGAVNGLKR